MRGTTPRPSAVCAGSPVTGACRLVIVVLVVLASVGCARLGGEAFQPTHNQVLPLGPDMMIGQTFRATSAELAGADLLVATFAQPADPAGKLEVVLRDAGTGQALRTVTVAGSQVPNNAWLPIRFHPPVTAPERAAIEVRWTSPRPIGLYASAPPPDGTGESQERLTENPYPHGTLLRDGEIADGDLAFRVLGLHGGRALPRVILGLLGGIASAVRGRPLFGVVWLGGLAGSVALAVFGFRRQRSAR